MSNDPKSLKQTKNKKLTTQTKNGEWLFVPNGVRVYIVDFPLLITASIPKMI